jgi:hypothetical protein
MCLSFGHNNGLSSQSGESSTVGGSFKSISFPFVSSIGIGNIIYLNAAGQPMVILNSQKVAADLLDRRAGIYSDRPRNIVASDIMTGGLLVVFTRYNDMCVLGSESLLDIDLHY